VLSRPFAAFRDLLYTGVFAVLQKLTLCGKIYTQILSIHDYWDGGETSGLRTVNVFRSAAIPLVVSLVFTS
jgi:hypothetical protein